MKKWLLISSIIIQASLFSQNNTGLAIRESFSPIVLDGELNEEAWKDAEKADNFYQTYPSDTSYAQTKTVAMITFDDNNIYVAAICYDDFPDKPYVIQSLKRDFSYPVSDAFAVFIDPFNDQVNGFSFAVNPLGVQREGLLQNGGSYGVTTAWDNKWFSEVKRYDDKWVVEMRIPLKSIRYNSKKTWGINFSRNDLKRNENSSWSPVPRNYNIATLAFTKELNWETPPKKAGTNISIIPYAIGSTFSDYQNNENESKLNGGFDAKIAVTSSLNLDITVNPDFSQVEVDRQVTNLSRFSLFFPERRQFFIENSDLFSQFGFRQIRPFFSRKIGLKNGSPVPIIAGARLSGKLNKDWRIGLMNMQTEGISNVDPQNYTVSAIQRRVGKRSSIDAIFVNRQGFSNDEINYADYNRILGLDYNLKSANNKYIGKAFYHHSFSPNITSNNNAHASWFQVTTERLSLMWNHEFSGENYRTDVGFVPRISQFNSQTGEIVYSTYWRLEPSLSYRFYPKSNTILNYEPGVYMSKYMNKDFKSTEQVTYASFAINFTNKSKFTMQLKQDEVTIPFPTDITFSGNNPIDSGEYRYHHFFAEYKSSPFKIFNFSLNTDYGEYFIGNKLTVDLKINYRKQPWGVFGLSITQNEIWMPEGFNNASLLLVGPEFQLSFTKKLFFTTFIQYNTQVENVNINARFQYRFKPMSDLFIVYTDNYNPILLGVKNRALVVKLIYWINL